MSDFLKTIACSGSECLSWILVLLNIFAIFYLIFCSFLKFSRFIKSMGFVLTGGLLCVTVGILIAHTCVYTLLATLFTAMMIMAILSIILPTQEEVRKEEPEEKKIKLGSYVISKTDDGRYVFALYDHARRFIVKSRFSYESKDEVKKEISVCRNNSIIADVNDKTGTWVKEDRYPMFETYMEGEACRFCFKVDEDYTIFESEAFEDTRACERSLDKAKALAASTAVYINTETVNGDNYRHYGKPSCRENKEIPEVVAEAKARQRTK